MHIGSSLQSTRNFQISILALAMLTSAALLSSRAETAQLSPTENLKQAREHWKRAVRKVETAQTAFDRAANEAFGGGGYARDFIAPYTAKVASAEIEATIAEEMARDAYKEAERQSLNPSARSTAVSGLKDYELLMEIVKAKKEALDDAKALFEEKVRDFLNRVDQDTKPGEPTVVETLDEALREREAAEEELERAQRAQAGESGQRSNTGRDLPGVGLTTEGLRSAGAPK